MFSAFLGMASVKVNIKKLSRSEIDFYCKNREDIEDTDDNSGSIVLQKGVWAQSSTPRKSAKKTKSRFGLSSSKKKVSSVQKRAEQGRAKRSIFEVDSDPCTSPVQFHRKKMKVDMLDEDAINLNKLMSFESPRMKYKLKKVQVTMRPSKHCAKIMRNLSLNLREEMEDNETNEKSIDEDITSSLPGIGFALPPPPPISKSQSDMFSSQEAPDEMSLGLGAHPQSSSTSNDATFIVGKVVNEQLSSDEETYIDEPEIPSLVMDVSRDLFSQSQEDRTDVNANQKSALLSTLETPVLTPSSQTPSSQCLVAAQSEEEDYQCLLCDETFIEKIDHQDHLKLKHCLRSRSGPPPPPCNLMRPETPPPPFLPPVPVTTEPRSTPLRSPPPRSPPPRSPPLTSCATNLDSRLLSSFPKPKLPKIPKLKVS